MRTQPVPSPRAAARSPHTRRERRSILWTRILIVSWLVLLAMLTGSLLMQDGTAPVRASLLSSPAALGSAIPIYVPII